MAETRLFSKFERRKFRSVPESPATAKHIGSGRELVIRSTDDGQLYKLTFCGSIFVNDKVRLAETSALPQPPQSGLNPLSIFLEEHSAEFWGHEGLMFTVYFDSFLLEQLSSSAPDPGLLKPDISRRR